MSVSNMITMSGGKYKMLASRCHNLQLKVMSGNVIIASTEWMGGYKCFTRHRAILWGDRWARLNYDKLGIHYGD